MSVSSTPQPATSEPPGHRRPFAAKYAHKGWGIALVVIGGLYALSSFGSFSNNVAAGIIGLILGLALVAWGVFLLRGRGLSPAAAERRRQAQAQQSHIAATSVQAAIAALSAAGIGGAGVVAWRNLDATIRQFYPGDFDAQAGRAIAASRVDLSQLNSPLIGTIPSLDGRGAMEVFQRWVILGQEAHDIDASTHGDVFVDGSIQVGANARHDLRTASVLLASSTWSVQLDIDPNRANDARRIIAQLASYVRTLQSTGVSGADIQHMIDMILSNTGQPPAEKLQQLSNLRYDRLISDDEFEQAKSKILGIR